MGTAAEAAQDMARVLESLVAARLFVAAYETADAVREGKRQVTQPSVLHRQLDLAEKAGERVHAYLTSGVDPIAATLWPDGGPV